MLISNLEYGIRKRQYAIDRLRKDRTTAGLGSSSAKRYLILQHAYDIIKYKRELFQRFLVLGRGLQKKPRGMGLIY